MTHEEKIKYMKIASGIVGYGFDDKGLDTLVSLYELIIVKKGETDLKSVLKVESEVNKRLEIRFKTEMLDKVSKKID